MWKAGCAAWFTAPLPFPPMVPPPQLYDLMTMGFKHQIVSCSSPTQLLQVTLNHMETVRGLVEGECIHVSQGCWTLFLIVPHCPSPYAAEGVAVAVDVVAVAVVVVGFVALVRTSTMKVVHVPPLPFSVFFLRYVYLLQAPPRRSWWRTRSQASQRWGPCVSEDPVIHRGCVNTTHTLARAWLR